MEERYDGEDMAILIKPKPGSPYAEIDALRSRIAELEAGPSDAEVEAAARVIDKLVSALRSEIAYVAREALEAAAKERREKND